MADRVNPEKKALNAIVRDTLENLEEVARLCDAGELAAMGLDEPRDAFALKQLLCTIGDRVRLACESLAPNGMLAP